MKKIITIFLMSSLSMNMHAQIRAIAGEYYLRDVMETASGFKFYEDNNFEFFFSYGGLDRGGSGTWAVRGDKIILNSPKPKLQGFILTGSKAVPNDSVTIQILEQNTIFLSNVHAVLISRDKQVNASGNDEGLISFLKQPFDSIELISEFAPEKKAVFPLSDTKDNYFEFRFDPSILDVIFKNLELKIEKDGLSGQHPLLKKGLYHFKKQ